MKPFQILRYLKKWRWLIIILFVCLTAASYFVLRDRQTYSASIVIEYTNNNANNGYAPDGTWIDTTEIYSSANVKKVMENLGLSYEDFNLDTLCSSISVTPVVSEQEESIQEAVNLEGEEYTAQPTVYIVTCKLDSSGSEELARNILNELMDVYFSDYSVRHINEGQISNNIRNIAAGDYDYIEIVEKMEGYIADTLSSLNVRYGQASDFRSSRTGYSFRDLWAEFSLIYQTEIPNYYSLILGNQLTKDKDTLINKYEDRVGRYDLSAQDAQNNIDDTDLVIDSYVNKMRESGNTNIDSEYILPDVYDQELYDGETQTYSDTDRTVNYDELLLAWTDAKNTKDEAAIDSAYCQYILNLYRNNDSTLKAVSLDKGTEYEQPAPAAAEGDEAAEEGAEALSEESAAEGTDVTMETEDGEEVVVLNHISTGTATAEDIEKDLQELTEKLNGLYAIVDTTNEEYNEYQGASNIRTRSSTSAYEGFNLKLYMIVVAVFFLLLGCGGAILLGRLGDILDYMFLRDRTTGCMNRVSFDNYIHDRENGVIALNTCCLSLQITNQLELNQSFGREETNRALRTVSQVLRDCFEGRPEAFVAYNGSGQFWVFYQDDSGSNVDQEAERLAEILRQSLENIPMKYLMGAAKAEDEVVFRIRKLISVTSAKRKLYSVSSQEQMN